MSQNKYIFSIEKLDAYYLKLGHEKDVNYSLYPKDLQVTKINGLFIIRYIFYIRYKIYILKFILKINCVPIC